MSENVKHATSVDQSDRRVPINLRQSGRTPVELLVSTRIRKSPFWHLSHAAGCWRATVYNRMYHPRGYVRPEDGGAMVEYDAIVHHVTLWNVAVERQIQVLGPGAEAFVNHVITRDATLHAEALWSAVLAAGAKHHLMVIAPAHHRRIAAGILSWGQDMDAETLPFQCNLGYQVPRTKQADYVGAPDFWLISGPDGGDPMGYVTSPWYSPEIGTNIAMGYVPWGMRAAGTRLKVRLPDEYADSPGVPVDAEVVAIPFRPSVNPSARELAKAAGLLPLFNMSYSVGQIHKYSVALYQTLEAETGQDVGFRRVGNIRLATNRDRMDEHAFYAGVAKTIGVQVEFLTPREIRAIWPLCNTQGVTGAIVHPEDGYIQPAELTQALARGARNGGAEIYRRTKVTGIERTRGGEWRIRTDQGDITCEHVVSATGNHVRQTGAMVGLDVPVIPVEHQFIVTEPHPEILERHEAGLPEMGVLREPDASYYMREEAGGLLLGPYEKGAPACFLDGPPEEFENDLFPADLDRLEPHIKAAIHRVPAFGEAGVKEVINGPIPYTPDGSPVIGPAWGLRNYWLNEGHSFGITAAGGAGWQLAEWMVEGEPTVDMLGVDPRRFGPYASRGYLKAKNEAAYASVFTVHFPDEERPAARPLKTAPCYHRMKALGAMFGQKYGWERPNWFRPRRGRARGRLELPPQQLLRARGRRVPARPRGGGGSST